MYGVCYVCMMFVWHAMCTRVHAMYSSTCRVLCDCMVCLCTVCYVWDIYMGELVHTRIWYVMCCVCVGGVSYSPGPKNPHFELSWGLIGIYKYNQGQKKKHPEFNSVVMETPLYACPGWPHAGALSWAPKCVVTFHVPGQKTSVLGASTQLQQARFALNPISAVHSSESFSQSYQSKLGVLVVPVSISCQGLVQPHQPLSLSHGQSNICVHLQALGASWQGSRFLPLLPPK